MTRSAAFLSVFCVTALLIGCSGTTSDTTTPSTGVLNAAATAVLGAKGKIDSSQILNSASASSLGVGTFAASDWTDPHLDDEAGQDCNNMSTPKSHLEEMQTSTCTTSPLFDLYNLMDVVCVATALLDADSQGNPDVFSGSVTITQAVSDACGMDGDAVGFDMQVTVEEITGNDDYLRKVTAVTGPTTRTIYWGRSADHFSLSFHYKDGGGDSAYKGFYYEDIANSTMAFELQSLKLTGPVNVSFFRFFLDESETVAEVKAVGSLKDMGDGGKHVRWTMAGDLSGTNEFAVSMKWNAQDPGTGTGVDTCVDPQTLAANGASASCGDFTAPSVMSFNTLAGATFTAISALDETTFFTSFDENHAADFDDSDIQSAAAVQ